MATSKSAQLTDFTQDILGRYICNGFDEALDSMDNKSLRPHAQSDARLFNALIIGSFDGVLAGHLYADKTSEMQSAIGQRRRVTALKQKAFLPRMTSIRARRMRQNLLATRIKNGAL